MILTRLQLYGLAIAAILLAGGWYTWKVYNAGQASIERQNDRATEDQLNERNETNEAINRLTDRELCERADGVWNNGTCNGR